MRTSPAAIHLARSERFKRRVIEIEGSGYSLKEGHAQLTLEKPSLR